jgi:hypothetical protein
MAQNATSLMCDWPVRGKTYVTTVVATTTGSLTVLAVLLRTVDAWMYDQFGWHDACALGAGIWAIPMMTVQLLVGPAGFGRDIWTVPFDKLVLIQKVCTLPDRAQYGVANFDVDGMAHTSLLLANNDARENVIPTFVPPDLSAEKASKMHSRNSWVESCRLGLPPIQQYLLLPSHIQSMGLGRGTFRALLEY